MHTALTRTPATPEWLDTNRAVTGDQTNPIPDSAPIKDTDMTVSISLERQIVDPLIDPLAPDSPIDDAGPPGVVDPEPLDVPIDDEHQASRAPVARCADGNGTMTGLFFSDHVVDIARAKAMCARCPLRVDCLAGALAREEPWGVWGGELISGGRIVANKRPCGRPPKHPRPEVVYDEMGPVGFDLTA